MWLSVLLSRNGFKCMFKGFIELAFNSCRVTWKNFPREEDGFTFVFSLPSWTKVNHSKGNKRPASFCNIKDKPRKAILQWLSGREDNCRNQTKAELKLQPQRVQLPYQIKHLTLLCTSRLKAKASLWKKGVRFGNPDLNWFYLDTGCQCWSALHFAGECPWTGNALCSLKKKPLLTLETTLFVCLLIFSSYWLITQK